MTQCQDAIRLIGFVVLHLATYVSNILTMVIVSTTGHLGYLGILLPVHCLIGLFCAWTAKTSIEWERSNFPIPLIFLFIFIVMGLMQGVQVKLAFDDYKARRYSREASLKQVEGATPNLSTAKFHCKAVDGIVEAAVFSFVSMYTLLKDRWLDTNVKPFEPWHKTILYIGLFFCILTMGLGLMEIDDRTSASARRLFDKSVFSKAMHLLFRASECGLRLQTGLAFVTFMRPYELWWLAFVILGADYILGVMLLMAMGGKDPMKFASFILALPLLVVNCLQFVDAPGMSLQARTISNIIWPFRTLQFVGVIIFCSLCTPVKVKMDHGDEGHQDLGFWDYLYEYQFGWLVLWAACAVIYYTLLFTYALKVKPEADIHSAVANGDTECLSELLMQSELVLDVNRYGPNGRTPLHLAALQGQVKCIELLVEQNANVFSRTGDRFRNTALHLAVKSNTPVCVTVLYQLAQNIEADPLSFLNATNSDGDTALHLACKKTNIDAIGELLQIPGIDVNLRNKPGQRAMECVPQSKFGFDRDSDENKVLELFAEFEVGIPQGLSAPSIELSDRSGSSRSAAQTPSALSSPSAGSNAAGVQRSPSANTAGMRRSLSGNAMKRMSRCGEQNVPLLSISQDAEDHYFQRSETEKAVARNASSAVTKCGLSSFMLSAGMGAVSKAFLSSVQENEVEKDTDIEVVEVKVKFDDFVEIKMLGEGAFGKVTLVRHKATNELFAMKIMNKAMFKAQKMTSKAISEQYILKTSRHPFIVGLNYAFQGSTFWALVMDYCPNGDLHDDLVKRGNPGHVLEEAARLSGQSLLALAFLHRINVIFRDLKLENVILDASMNAKITDFGLAKKLNSDADARTLCGSYGYAAPEVMHAGTKSYTKAVDLYSFGVMLYMLVSGGEAHPEKAKQRLPPMKHTSLRRKIKDAKAEAPGEWAKEEVGALELIDHLTSENVALRTTAVDVGKHRFYTNLLGSSVECLLDLPVSYAISTPGESLKNVSSVDRIAEA